MFVNNPNRKFLMGINWVLNSKFPRRSVLNINDNDKLIKSISI